MTPAILALEDGTVFHGRAIGAFGEAVGEVVFNTAMTGYQEIVSDPSYARQIVTLTCPHIGNVGANDEDIEAQDAYACGLVVRDYPSLLSNFRSQESLSEFLSRQNVVGISDIDTRQLTRLLREKGAQNGCLQAGSIDEEQAIAQAQAFAGLKGGLHRVSIPHVKCLEQAFSVRSLNQFRDAMLAVTNELTAEILLHGPLICALKTRE